jgi:hypothetical protein
MLGFLERAMPRTPLALLAIVEPPCMTERATLADQPAESMSNP